MPDLTVTLIQSELAWEDIDANLAMFDDKINSIDAPGDLVVLPEMFSTGFSMNAPDLAESMDGKTVTWMRQKARQINTTLAGSVIVRDNGRFFNRMLLANPDGRLDSYDKKHLFRYAGEDKVYTQGQTHTEITIGQWRIRPFICYDLRFPIWTRNLDLTYDLALFTANWPARRSAHWRTLLKARAIENQCYVIGVNRVGTDGNALAYAGHSAVISPTGEVLFEVAEKEALYTIRLSRSLLDDYRKTFPAWMDSDGNMLKNDKRR